MVRRRMRHYGRALGSWRSHVPRVAILDSGAVGLWVSVCGTALSLIGLIVALRQIGKTRDAASAATEAASKATAAVQDVQLMSEFGAYVHSIGDAKVYIRRHQLDAAYVVLADTLHRLNLVRHIPALANSDDSGALASVIGRLVAVREQLELQLSRASGSGDIDSFDYQKALRSLSKAEDMVGERLGKLMYAEMEG